MRSRGTELGEWSEAAVKQLRGPVLTGVRRKLAQWRDPRARLIRQRRRAKRTTGAGATTTGLLGGGAVLSFAPWMQTSPVGDVLSENLLDVTGVGLSGFALATAAGTIGAWRKYRRLTRTPLPDPAPEPVQLPAVGSQAREPMQQLRDAEQSLHGALQQLAADGTGAGGDSVSDARKTADNAAAALRGVSGRLCAVEAAVEHAPEAERSGLRNDVRRLRSELDEGVEGYRHLVAAAGKAVAASGAPEQKHLMQDATDRLAGLAAALQELSGGGDDPSPGTSAGIVDSTPETPDVAAPREARKSRTEQERPST